MTYQVISDVFSQEIADINVEAVLFTTYNLELSFFETEVVPLLFNNVGAFSNDVRIKELQVREKLESSKIVIDLFYDEDMFYQEQQSNHKSSPSMEYGFYGIAHHNGAFHPKISLVLGINRTGEKELILFAGSNNLTKAGWWDNVETVNFIRISVSNPPSEQILVNIKKLLDYLSQKLKMEESALSKIERFLESIMVLDKKASGLFFYFSTGTNFPAFLKENLRKEFRTIEIISPYFPNNSHSTLYKDISAEGKLYLPIETSSDINIAQCTESFYVSMQEQGFVWSRFQHTIEKELNSSKRLVHAKLFIMAMEEEYWAFSGSVNFTHKAFYDNVEAGFLFKGKHEETVLEPLLDMELRFLPEKTAEESEETKSVQKDLSFDVQLFFDWKAKAKKLYVYGELPKDKELLLKDQDDHVLMSIDHDRTVYPVSENDALVKHLEKNGYVKVFCCGQSKEMYVQQKNWVFKPLNYPDLSIEEIISIYAAMDPKKRERYIVSALIQKFVQSGEETEYTRSIDEISEAKHFFSEYAELFYAFRRVDDACKEEPSRREYYLFAERPDSIHSLLGQLEKDEKNDNVMKYLVLLSAKELYEKYGYNFDKYKVFVKKVKSEFADKKFLKWFEKEFKKEYRKKVDNDS